MARGLSERRAAARALLAIGKDAQQSLPGIIQGLASEDRLIQRYLLQTILKIVEHDGQIDLRYARGTIEKIAEHGPRMCRGLAGLRLDSID